jgi:hypothetical protein
MLFARIVPLDKTLNLVELRLFSAVANMAPALVFTLLNESDVSLRWAIASLDIFFFLRHIGVSVTRSRSGGGPRCPADGIYIEQVAVDDESLA